MYPTVVSIFCGAGGMDLGFMKAGFKIIWGIDINKDSCISHRDWSNVEIINDDIHNIDKNTIPSSDVILGSLLSNGFSTGIKSNWYTDEQKYIDIVLDIIKCKRPKVFLVDGHKIHLNMKTGILKNYLNKLNDTEYEISYKVLNTKDYSIAQNKERFVLVGLRKDLNYKYQFPLKHSNLISVREVIKDLGAIDYKDRKCVSQKSLESSSPRWNGIKYINLDGLSPSINTKTQLIREDISPQFGKYYTISWQEAAAIQSFSRDTYFHGSLKSKFNQIANAFPPQLAYHLAKELFFIIENINYKEETRESGDLNEYIENNEEYYEINTQLLKNADEPLARNYECLDKESDLLVMIDKLEVSKQELTEAEELIYQIKSIPTGGESANDYHNLIFCCLQYIFGDSLKRGRTEVKLNNSRKRIDIVFDNYAASGFFAHIRDRHHVFCPRIIIECKNYTSDPSNPEVDQLLGRLGEHTGKLGILICREVQDYQKLLNRCKDVLNQFGSYIFFLTDNDIKELLKLKQIPDEEGILEYLSSVWDRLTMNN
ncbi:DNA cytosine methyltransferase [Paenibacillus sp. RS8]|uniref:DNA cytosine methyltransferase n=1 Tax=Paenibacillus sp. RS8 TaxID=3242681 RepID=UPI0035C16D2D